MLSYTTTTMVIEEESDSLEGPRSVEDDFLDSLEPTTLREKCAVVTVCPVSFQCLGCQAHSKGI